MVIPIPEEDHYYYYCYFTRASVLKIEMTVGIYNVRMYVCNNVLIFRKENDYFIKKKKKPKGKNNFST